MGISGIGIWQLVIILAIIVLLFGTKRLRSVGSDLGSAIKSFKKSVADDDAKDDAKDDLSTKNVEHQEGQSAEAKQQEKTEQK